MVEILFMLQLGIPIVVQQSWAAFSSHCTSLHLGSSSILDLLVRDISWGMDISIREELTKTEPVFQFEM